MAIKAHLRNQRPVVIALTTNDALGMNAKNIGLLLNAKHIYFVPFRQDDPTEKVNSVAADMSLAVDTVISALQGRQIQPLLLGSR
jgi:dipicolinate synthase subunit B